MTVDVFNLRTGKTISYLGITPMQAIINAAEADRGNHNTWDYEKSNIRPDLINGKYLNYKDLVALI